ncbi:hypothetical protein EPA93_18590 [Ktedonosporobacter rubrisoli]|uniref:SMP-30/Gluconolactonase/LRE-like region domain-containing protein n=1 Tax=Ktedonosporobacter rubrisoli TaxID=2509675 RepID=A0A4P6JRR2_KTERU|nr:hypothetical protein [Ktedonosporobacter rubrisoli]QBD77892.1 hypothetical protein EPA93_18590 [Ktedonosporobacter rubrisoli]
MRTKIANNGSDTMTPTPVNRAHPVIELPASTHRVQATTATQAGTSLNPWGIAIDSEHGFVWVAEPGCEPLPKCQTAFPGIIGKYSLADGSFIEDMKEPAGYSSPLFAAVDPNGHIWFTQPTSDAIGELDPQHKIWHQWPVSKNSSPYDLLFDKRGNIWFTEMGGNHIGFFNPTTHKLVETPIPTTNSNPYGITMDPQGNIWFTENREGVSQIGSFTPTESGTISISEHPAGVKQPHLITADKAGNIWYSAAFAGQIGEFIPSSNTNTIYTVTGNICPNPLACYNTHISGIAADAKGNIWFTDSLSARVGYLIPASGAIKTITVPRKDAHPHDGLAVDKYNTVWFTEQNEFELVMWPDGTLK